MEAPSSSPSWMTCSHPASLSTSAESSDEARATTFTELDRSRTVAAMLAFSGSERDATTSIARSI